MILVSAGHHEGAQGATWNGYTEWPQACLWRDQLVRYLGDSLGLAVPDGTLPDKVDFINANTAICAIEIHFNSAKVNGVHVGRGCETLYEPDNKRSDILAASVHNALRMHFRPDRGIKEGWYRMDRPGVVDYDGDVEGDEKLDYFLWATHCPAVVIEPEFIQYIDEIDRRRAMACKAMADQLFVMCEQWGLL